MTDPGETLIEKGGPVVVRDPTAGRDVGVRRQGLEFSQGS